MIERLNQVSGRDVPRETFGKLEAFAALLAEESGKHNLIAASTIGQLWERHLLDSAQLLRLGRAGSWVDIGSGAGLPGIVIAIVIGGPITLVEPRRLRAEFLATVKIRLSLDNVTIVQAKSTALSAKFDNITARAVAPATELLAMTHHLSHSKTVWVLLKGRSAQKELDDVRAAWQGAFRLEPSLTDEAASILLATGVKPRETR
jgi:16S rRNA (guanine527-N7)-methyltransferase